MRVLFLSPRTLWPPQSGGRARAYHLAKAAGKASELTIVTYRDPDAMLIPSEHLGFAEHVVEVPMPQKYSKSKILQGLFSSQPFPVLNYHSTAMAEAIAKTLDAGTFDLIHADTTLMTSFAPIWKARPKAPVCLYDWHNIDSELMARFGEGQSSPLRMAYAGLTSWKYRGFERRILGHDYHMVCSVREKALLLDRVPEARVAVVESGVDTAQFSPEFPRAAKSDLVFVGSMDYHANIDAVLWFVEEFWPAIRQAFPALRLVIVGSRPVEKVLALRGDERITVTGTVDSVGPYYEEALAAIVPIRSGSGTRLKILEAMAAGVPVLSTRLGAEGIPVKQGENILLAENAGGWVEAISGLLDSRDLQNTLAGNALKMVRAQYDWARIGDRMFDFYRSAVHAG